MPIFTPHQYQREAIDFLSCRLWIEDELGAGLFLDPGLGKTSISLETVWQAKARGWLRKVLIIAPLRVIYSVWPNEIRKWKYPLTWSIVHGSATARQNALLKNADIYLINPEGVPWLADQYEARFRKTFDLLIVDESTKFKTWSAKCSKALRKILKRFDKRVILTGTPAPNSYCDLPSQAYICDDGAALGKTIGAFRANFARPGGYMGEGWEVPEYTRPLIEARISPMVLRMSAEDHLDMPPRVDNEIWVDLPPKIQAVYDALEKEFFAELDSGSRLEASSAGAKYAILKQIANGGAYQTDDLLGTRSEIAIHDTKVDAIKDIVEELSGKPVLIAYQYNHDATRLAKAFPKAPIIRGGQSAKESAKIIDVWNAGRVSVLLVQPQALSHGANMQAGGRDLVWCGHTDRLEIFIQLNARLYRQGQTGQVRFHHVMANRTVDRAVWERLQDKDASQAALLAALKRYRDKGTNV